MVYVIGIVAALIILFGFLCYKKAPPTEAIVVTGFGLSKPKVVCGKGTFVLPVLQRADRLNMRLLKIDVKTPETGVKTKNGVSLWIDSVVTIQVYSENSTVLDEEVKASGLKDAKAYIMSRQQAAISNFLGMNEQGINEKVNDVLQGNLREIVSDMTVDQILTNRKQMAVSVIENARPDLAKSEQLFGIEMYRKVYALACANMMIHKDGKTNLVQMDATSAEATEWIRKQKITKTLMNPPYERRYGCATIVANVLDSVPAGTKCAFILPDKKMEKESKLKALLERHTLTTIIKLPENLFFGLGVTTSIFIFETGKPQNGRNIKGYYVADDGLETVKNKGRQDVHDKWPALEDYWVKAIQDDNDDRYNTRQLINPAEHLSYQMPEKPFELYEEDFIKTVMDYEMYKRGINAKEFGDKLLQKVLYGSTVTGTEEGTNILVEKGKNNNGED